MNIFFMATQTAGDSNECEIMQILFHCRLKHFPKVFREALLARHTPRLLPGPLPARPDPDKPEKKALSPPPTTRKGHFKLILP